MICPGLGVSEKRWTELRRVLTGPDSVRVWLRRRTAMPYCNTFNHP